MTFLRDNLDVRSTVYRIPAEQIKEAAERLGKETAEALAHTALTCGRTPKTFAVATYPATYATPACRTLEAHYVNRLWQYA